MNEVGINGPKWVQFLLDNTIPIIRESQVHHQVMNNRANICRSRGIQRPHKGKWMPIKLLIDFGQLSQNFTQLFDRRRSGKQILPLDRFH
ncbi:unnamed protein product [Tuber aestivum]|uniref:Uncharacterized protein n=1 Tax=Tuber aestivum TaxID=59557 RepID=A0A292Q6Y8_9PEZI|nr:unnamed protein product [Tuber aestivum]